MKKEIKNLKEINMLLDIKSNLEELSKAKITYYGLKNLNPDKTYPLFIQWNHNYPMLGIGTSNEERYMPLPREIGQAIEILLGNAEDSEDFDLQIKEAFRRKEQCLKK